MKNTLYTLLAFAFLSSTIKAQDILPAKYFFKSMQKRELAVQLLDVRTDGEYKQSHLKKAKHINVLEDKFVERVSIEFSKDKPIYLYCKSGGRSNIAAEKLQEAGFKTIDLQGGITAWELQNLPLEAGAED